MPSAMQDIFLCSTQLPALYCLQDEGIQADDYSAITASSLTIQCVLQGNGRFDLALHVRC